MSFKAISGFWADTVDCTMYNQQGTISRKFWQKLCEETGVLSPFGGDDQSAILTSMRSMALYAPKDTFVDWSLATGIEGTLVVQILKTWGKNNFNNLIEEVIAGKKIGGLAVTEEGVSGSEVGKIKCFCKEGEYGTVTVKTAKTHPKWFQGWSGQDFLIVLAYQDGNNRKPILVKIDRSDIAIDPIDTEGLTSIPYARNTICATNIDKRNVIAELSPNDILQLFLRGRYHFIGMEAGIMERIHNIYEEDLSSKNDTVQEKKSFELEKMKSRKDVCDGIYEYVCDHLSPSKLIDRKTELYIANTIKVISSSLVQESADELRRLQGAAAVECGHYASHIAKSVHAFTVFEGPNEMLLQQIYQKHPDKEKAPSEESDEQKGRYLAFKFIEENCNLSPLARIYIGREKAKLKPCPI